MLTSSQRSLKAPEQDYVKTTICLITRFHQFLNTAHESVGKPMSSSDITVGRRSPYLTIQTGKTSHNLRAGLADYFKARSQLERLKRSVEASRGNYLNVSKVFREW